MYIVRNSAVRCIGSILRIRGIENDYQAKRHLDPTDLDRILHEVCNETMDYEQLLALYNQASTGTFENDSFVAIEMLDSTHGLRVDQNHRILHYYFQDKLIVNGIVPFPWAYPHAIGCVGCENGQTVAEIMQDFSNLSTIAFLAKYMFAFPCPDGHFTKKAEGIYLLDPNLEVRLDWHITLFWRNDKGQTIETYLADTWWYEDDEILEDLMNKSPLEFGHEYQAYWEL